VGRRSSLRHAAGAAALLATASVLVACGGDAPPAESVPALADRLERVDAAIADDRPERARRAVEALVDEATRARMDGSITADQADEILRAAGELLARLGTAEDDTSPDQRDPATPSPPTDMPDEDEGEPEPSEDDDDGPDDKDKGKQKHKDKHKA
jgi:hypothetical protein